MINYSMGGKETNHPFIFFKNGKGIIEFDGRWTILKNAHLHCIGMSIQTETMHMLEETEGVKIPLHTEMDFRINARETSIISSLNVGSEIENAVKEILDSFSTEELYKEIFKRKK